MMKWHKNDVRVTDDCWLETHVGHEDDHTIVYTTVGQDMHMNGMDAPARLNSPDDARKLMAALQLLVDHWPTYTTFALLMLRTVASGFSVCIGIGT